MAEATKKPNNTWLIRFREWHTWGGVGLSVFIVAVCATGIYLNHKDLFHGKVAKAEPESVLSTATVLGAVPMRFDTALAMARDRWGEVPIEKIELKDDHGRLVYKVKRNDGGGELIIAAASGSVSEKVGYTEAGGLNLGKLFLDIHTGKIAGLGGKLLVDLTSLVLMGLTLTGIYLWWVPLRRKQRSAREREQREAARRQPEPIAAS